MFTVAGLILLLAGSNWFVGAHTVGLVCFGAGFVLEIIPLVAVIVTALLISDR
jgi:hypothetical protein